MLVENPHGGCLMSRSELLKVIAELPEKCLERAISDCLVSLMADGEYYKAEQIISRLSLGNIQSGLRLRAMVLAVQIACRKKDVALALSRYGELGQFGESENTAQAKSAALLQLASLLLPDSPTRLLALWEDNLTENLPFHAQHDLAAVGMMLGRCFLRSGAKDQARTICRTIAGTLEPEAYGKELARLERTICQAED